MEFFILFPSKRKKKSLGFGVIFNSVKYPNKFIFPIKKLNSAAVPFPLMLFAYLLNHLMQSSAIVFILISTN